jgi:repressor LexA
MKKELTKKQRQIFDYIKEHLAQRGAPPTIREIMSRFRISSTNGVRCHLTALANKQVIKLFPYRSRGIELTERAVMMDSPHSIPIIGRVAAGEPILAEQNIEGRIAVDPDYLGEEGVFALKVRGDSMIEAGIFDGDLVFARSQPMAEKGEIVVAVIGDDATIKYYRPDNGNVRLEPANPAYPTIVVERNTPGFYIAGKVVGVFRKY